MTHTLETSPVVARLAVRRSLVRMDMLHLGVPVDDDVVNAIVRAIQIRRGDWNPADHPRNPAGSVGGGKFRSLTARISDALKTRKKDGTGDPLEGFDREQVRKTAVKLGLKLRRGASEAEIKKLLLDHADAGHPLDEPKPKAPDAADPKAPSLEVELDALIKDNNRKLTRPATKHLKEAVAYLGHGSPDLALDRLKKAKVEQEYSRPGTKVPFIDDFIERLTPKPKTTKKAAAAKKVAAPSAPTPQPAAKKATPLSALGVDGKPIPLPSKEYRDRAILGDKEYERRQAAKKAAPAKRAPATAAPTKKVAAPLDRLPRMSRPESTRAAAKATNPHYGTTQGSHTYRDAGKAGKRWTPDMGPLPSGAYEENCSNVVYAFEMRMRGYDVEAAPLDILDKYGYAGGRTSKEMDQLLADAWRLPDGSPHGRTLSGQDWRSFAEIDADIEQNWPEGGRGVIFVGKHIFSVVKVRGKAQFVEAQFDASASRAVTTPYKKKYRGSRVFSGPPQDAKLIRLDDLEPADGVLEAVTPSGQ